MSNLATLFAAPVQRKLSGTVVRLSERNARMSSHLVDESDAHNHALDLMPHRFTTGDFARYAGCSRLSAERFLSANAASGDILRAGNAWERHESEAKLMRDGTLQRRCQHVLEHFVDGETTATEFMLDAMTGHDTATKFLKHHVKLGLLQSELRLVQTGKKRHWCFVFWKVQA